MTRRRGLKKTYPCAVHLGRWDVCEVLEPRRRSSDRTGFSPPLWCCSTGSLVLVLSERVIPKYYVRTYQINKKNRTKYLFVKGVRITDYDGSAERVGFRYDPATCTVATRLCFQSRGERVACSGWGHTLTILKTSD